MVVAVTFCIIYFEQYPVSVLFHYMWHYFVRTIYLLHILYLDKMVVKGLSFFSNAKPLRTYQCFQFNCLYLKHFFFLKLSWNLWWKYPCIRPLLELFQFYISNTDPNWLLFSYTPLIKIATGPFKPIILA